MQMGNKPLGEQERPVASEENVVLGNRVLRRVVISGFESREMAKAYLAWLESGEAHAAFGNWFDAQGG